jgi:dihydroflavonol-4-reductase
MVLVTGGTGLVGAHLLLHLVENEASVRAIYRNSESLEKTKMLFSIYKKESLFKKIEWIQADIIKIPSLKQAFENIDYVYHCAGLISFDPKDEDILRKTNIEGTANIVNFCIDFAVKKICFVSSIAALGDLKENEKQISEETEWNPEIYHSDYAISKYGAEMEIWRGQQEGVDTVVVNPGIILGPGFWNQGSGLLFKKIADGFPFYTEGTTGFIAVTDVVEIMTALMKNKTANERFILVAQNSSFREILNTIADALQVKRPRFHATQLVVNIAYRIDGIISIVLNRKRILDKNSAKASYSKNYYSNEKISRELNFKFLDIHDYIKAISKL